jgi:hypothetical protein
VGEDAPVTVARPVPSRRRWRGAVVVLVLGFSLIAVAATLWVVGWMRYGDTGHDTSREASDVRDRFTAELAVPGEADVELSAGRQLVYVVAPASGRTDENDSDGAADGLTVRVTSADGVELGDVGPALSGSSTSVFSGNGTDFDLELAAEVEVPADGDYTVTVEGVPADGITVAGIVAAVDPHAGADAALAGGALYLLGLLVGGLGGLIVFVGAIWLLVVRLSTPAPPTAWGAPPAG